MPYESLFLITVIAVIMLWFWLMFFARKRRILPKSIRRDIQKRIKKFENHEPKTAVMEADKLLDHTMKKKGLPGETLGERLKQNRSLFHNINEVWWAHKLRNALAHDIDANVSQTQARQAIKNFKATLKDLGI